MKLKPEFIAHESDDTSVLVPTGDANWSGVIQGNKTFGAILELLKDDVTEQEIVDALHKRFDAPEGAIERDVTRALDELRKIGAVE